MASSLWLAEEDALPSPKQIDGYVDYPDGLMAISQSMTPERLIEAYQKGIFPWYSEDQPVLWWCTSPRMTLQPSELIVHHSLRKKIKQIISQPEWAITVDGAFTQVIANCALSPRAGQDGTWITAEIQTHYIELFHQKIAHSVEVWHQGHLVGGLYGINLGKMFYGESMFMKVPDASKVALAALCAACLKMDIPLIDCQQETQHLASLGAKPLEKIVFLNRLETLITQPAPIWNFDKQILAHWV